MKEKLLHYIWQRRLFYSDRLTSIDGEAVEIVDVGQANSDAGPDFFNAKVKIGDTLWAGNVEIHRTSSDWLRHKHHTNKAYDNVILHVVEIADTEIYRTNGAKIPQIVLKYSPKIDENFAQLLASQKWLACEDKIKNIPPDFIENWKNALLVERIEQKSAAIYALLEQNQNHWEEAFYIVLARNFGFSTNGAAFEMLAKSLPLNILGKHKDQLLQIEALLFGQSGLLPEKSEDEYTHELKREYHFLHLKYNLTPLQSANWKLLRLRPDNFPHIRIAQFAALVHRSVKLFSKIIECHDIDFLRKLFDCEVSAYWQMHYLFGNESSHKIKKIGTQTIDTLIINSVVPFLFAYSKNKNKANLQTKAFEILQKMPSEKNAIITKWEELGISSHSAAHSQALLQLKKQYCDQRKCLRCRIGHKIVEK